MNRTNKSIIEATRCWVETVVVGLNLCPFAGRVLRDDSIRFEVSSANSEDALLADLHDAVLHLDKHSEVATSLLIHPNVLEDFEAYNQFLDDADHLLHAMGKVGVYQVASFHPGYQFAGTLPDDAENYTNRSPFPMLHILREESVSSAIAHYPDVASIPTRNIALLQKMGSTKLAAQLSACRDG